MKVYFILLFLVFNITAYSQSEKTLEETKAYIVKMISEYGGKEYIKHESTVEFDGNLFKTSKDNGSFLGTPIANELTYDFTNVYRFKGPIREPGNIGELIIWVDSSSDPKKVKWSKRVFKIYIYDYTAAEELMKAFKHLNKLLLQNKPQVEKF